MNVPKLRFKEFNDEWKTELFKNVFEFSPNNSLSRNDLNYNNQTNILNIHYGDILVKINNILDINSFELPSININHYEKLNNKKNFLTSGDIVIADTAEDYTAGKVIELYAVENKKIISGLHTIPIHPTIKFSPKFLGYYMNSNYYHNQLIPLITGIKVMSISKGNLENTYINYPQNIEQEKIGKFLSLLDKKIELQSKKIDALKLYKKGLFYNIRFETMQNFKLSDFLKEQNEKSIVINQYDILSSTANGLFLQSEYFNKQAASENNIGYKILKRNQLVLSPQNLWMGNININDKYDVGIVSPSYKIFNIDTSIINIQYFNNWIRSPRALYEYMISSEQGASIVRRNLNIDLFNSIILKLPPIDIQNKIGEKIYLFNRLIELEISKLSKLQELKKGLMQNMFV